MRAPASTAVRELLPAIEAESDPLEAERRIPDDLADRIRDSRLARMALPQELGGLESPPSELLEVLETLAAANASVSWVVWNNVLPALFGRKLSSTVRQEIFGDVRELHANSTRPTGFAAQDADGYVVRGRWSLVSGCQTAAWLSLLCLVTEGGRPREESPKVLLVFVRGEDVEIIDTWASGGLRGTGSHDVVVEDVKVPARRTLSPWADSTVGGPLGRIPIVATLGAGFAAQVLGVARQGVDTIEALARTKITPGPGPDLRDRAENQAGFVIHGAALAAARALLFERAERVWTAAGREGGVGLPEIGDLWGSVSHAIHVGRSALDAMYATGGTSSLYTTCPLERGHRDLHAMLRHVLAGRQWAADAGRVRFGLDPVEPLYAV